MEPVRVLKNSINNEDAEFIINYINKNQDSFITGSKRLRFQKMFGDDKFHKEQSAKIITGIDEIQNKIETIINLSVKSISDEFKDNQQLYLSSFWLAKQLPGAQVRGHLDTDSGFNDHYEYSAILYLNTPNNSGPLEFPYLSLEIMPMSGDLVIFKSAENTSFHEVKFINEDRYSVLLWFTKDKNYELKFGAK